MSGPHSGTRLTIPIVKTRNAKKQGLNHARAASVNVRKNRSLLRSIVQTGEFKDSAAQPDRSPALRGLHLNRNPVLPTRQAVTVRFCGGAAARSYG
jgi:hypothetical protein